MELFFPSYYHSFRCIADRCPDSCCHEWAVDIDPDTAAYYRQLPGDLGDRLRSVLQDTEDGTVMTIENGRCPMWRADGLCRIHAELGHDALSQTCREFPRLRHDYGNFAELGLELSCPVAAKLILNSPAPVFAVSDVPENEEPDYDSDVMSTLLRSRQDFLAYLDTTAHTSGEVLAVLLLYGCAVQNEIDGGEAAVMAPDADLADARHFAEAGDMQAVLAFFRELEILTSHWRERLDSPVACGGWDPRTTALLRYLVQRYWLQAVSDFDLICRVKFMVVACLLINRLGGNFVQTAQQFSKEIENDPDNLEAIFDGAYTCPAFTDAKLLGLLLNP